jgi:hypothetical protein
MGTLWYSLRVDPLCRLFVVTNIDNGSDLLPRYPMKGHRLLWMNTLVGLILDGTALAFIINEGAPRLGATVAAEVASAMSIGAGATCEAASKEKGRCYEEADDGSPGEAEGIAAD